ncbi:hypothetical protein ACFLX0_03750 [Chloroflexota bacterium]
MLRQILAPIWAVCFTVNQLCAATEGKSPNSLAIVINSVTYLYDFLRSSGLNTDVTQIGSIEMRTFILYLQQKRCFSNHPCSKAQQRGLSGHTINTYARSIRAFWSWLVEEEKKRLESGSQLSLVA